MGKQNRCDRASGVFICSLLLTHVCARKATSNRDWAEADWERIEQEMQDPEEKAEREAAIAKAERAGTGMGLTAAKGNPFAQPVGKGAAMGVVFVTVDFPGCCDNVSVDPHRRKVTELARKWSALLASTGMDASGQMWKDNQIGFQTLHEVRRRGRQIASAGAHF